MNLHPQKPRAVARISITITYQSKQKVRHCGLLGSVAVISTYCLTLNMAAADSSEILILKLALVSAAILISVFSHLNRAFLSDVSTLPAGYTVLTCRAPVHNNIITLKHILGETIPVRSCGCPSGYETSRLPHFLKIG
jgi:hypothetical protein